MPDRPQLYLLDGMALAYRAYFAMINSPRIASNGLNTSAPYGFLNSLLEILKNRQPTHIAVAFDTADPTFRHDMYPAYKAQRQAMPEDLADALPWVRKIIEAMRIPILICPGFEADDIIGTLVQRAEADGFQAWMVTPDKDFAQLVTDRITLYRLAAGREADIFTPAEVCSKWGVATPALVLDILGLQGDPSDNIPGVPSVGPKTAQKLLADYGSLEAAIAAAPTIKGKLGEKLLEFADQAILSKELARIKCDVPVEVNWDDLLVESPDEAALRQIFEALEFRTLAARMFGENTPAAAAPAAVAVAVAPLPASGQLELDLFGDATIPLPATAPADDAADSEPLKTIANTPHSYHIVRGDGEIDTLFAEFATADAFTFDFETDGLEFRSVNILGLALSRKCGEAYYLPFPADKPGQLTLLRRFEVLMLTPGITKIAHNARFDLGLLRWRDISWEGPVFDTMLADHLLAPDGRHKMDEVSRRLLHYLPIPITDLIGNKGKDQLDLTAVALEQVAEYAAEDADVTFRIAQVQRPQLAEVGMERLFHDIECPLIPVLLDMSHAGIAIDLEALAAYSKELTAALEKLTATIYRFAGTADFNIDSPKQLGEILFERLQLVKKPKKTPTGQYATGEEVLRTLAGRHPIIEAILRYRELRKLKNTYVDALPGHVWPATGRIHTEFDQAAAITGRMASSNPNLQNIPIRTEEGREIRRAFIPSIPGWQIMAADYSQIELRIIAHLSQDPALCEAFRNGEDIHTATAARIFDVEPLFVTSDMRRKAKMVNFGIAYGISAFGLAQRLNCSRTEAADIISSYFQRFPGVQHYMEDTLTGARDNGYVTTLVGRRRYLRDINSRNNTIRTAAERTAINAPIQGAAADMIKIAMIRVHNALKAEKLQTKLLLQVHDELVLEGPPEELQAVGQLLHTHMTEAMPLSIPVSIQFGHGANWLEAH